MPSTTQKKPKAGGSEVLKSLPRTRPHTRSTKRAATAGKPAAPKATATKATKSASAKPKKKAAKAAPTSSKASAKSKPAVKRKPATARKAAPKKKATPVKPVEATTASTSSDANSPIDLVANVVTRAGELAQVGASIGQAVVKNALSRISR